MKIRTITTGVNLTYPVKESAIRRAARFNLQAKHFFEKRGFEVQSVRISTQPWPEYLGGLSGGGIIRAVETIEELAADHGVTFVSIGTAARPRHIDLLPEIIGRTKNVSASASIGDSHKGVDYAAARAAARAIIKISRTTERGYGNFRFAAVASCPPDTPFYPAGYHRGSNCFSIGLECSDLVVRSFLRSVALIRARKVLTAILQTEFSKIEAIGNRLARSGGFKFMGVDVSIAPAITKRESLTPAYEKLGLGRFGAAGTLAVSSLITDALRSLKIKKCGYSGLMLPVLEDWGLARRFGSGKLGIMSLLAFSSVCGTGLDCVPLPGDVSADKLYALLLDVAALAVKLNKPLSARLLPVPGKKAGDRTDFHSPYLVDSRIPDLRCL
jgi:uncharacterized protein (UPF0210 family)